MLIGKNSKLAGALALSIGLTLAGCGGMATNRSLESVKQPVVERTNYTLDVRAGAGGLSIPEQQRVAGWFEAMNLRYGDRVSIEDPMMGKSTRDAISALAMLKLNGSNVVDCVARLAVARRVDGPDCCCAVCKLMLKK